MIKSEKELLDALSLETLREHLGQNVEFKRSWDQKYGQKFSGLANKALEFSAWFVVGVEDTGKLSGHDEKWAKGAEEVISQQINLNLDPIQSCKAIKCISINLSWVIIVEIGCPGAVTFWAKRSYKMSGTTALEMPPEEEMALTMSLPGLRDFSRQPFSGDTNKSYCKEFLAAILKKRPEMSDHFSTEDYEKALCSLKLLQTNTARILFGDFSYRVVFYDDNGNPEKNESRKGLFGILKSDFIDEIQEWSRSQSNLKHGPFSEKGLKEGLANCVAHAAYFHAQGDITIEVFPKKLCISNFCLPESGHFANKWFSRSHYTINTLLMESLRLAGFVDELGRGKNLIFSESIKEGKAAPFVHIEKAGRFNRWRLFIFGSMSDNKHLRLLGRLRKIYANEQKALLAQALVLWSKHPATTIKTFIDGESAPLFVEVISDLNGPVFFYQKDDSINLRRWVRVLLEEGKDSKCLSLEEEGNLYDLAYDLQMKYEKGFVSPKILRQLAKMTETPSEKVLSSTIIKKWLNEGKVKKMSMGKYQFITKKEFQTSADILLKYFTQIKP